MLIMVWTGYLNLELGTMAYAFEKKLAIILLGTFFVFSMYVEYILKAASLKCKHVTRYWSLFERGWGGRGIFVFNSDWFEAVFCWCLIWPLHMFEIWPASSWGMIYAWKSSFLSDTESTCTVQSALRSAGISKDGVSPGFPWQKKQFCCSAAKLVLPPPTLLPPSPEDLLRAWPMWIYLMAFWTWSCFSVYHVYLPVVMCVNRVEPACCYALRNAPWPVGTG